MTLDEVRALPIGAVVQTTILLAGVGRNPLIRFWGLATIGRDSIVCILSARGPGTMPNDSRFARMAPAEWRYPHTQYVTCEYIACALGGDTLAEQLNSILPDREVLQ